MDRTGHLPLEFTAYGQSIAVTPALSYFATVLNCPIILHHIDHVMVLRRLHHSLTPKPSLYRDTSAFLLKSLNQSRLSPTLTIFTSKLSVPVIIIHPALSWLSEGKSDQHCMEMDRRLERFGVIETVNDEEEDEEEEDGKKEK